MRFAIAALLVAGGLHAQQEAPIHVLPYTPSLEMKFVDKAVDPCIDFYKFACGHWNQDQPDSRRPGTLGCLQQNGR